MSRRRLFSWPSLVVLIGMWGCEAKTPTAPDLNLTLTPGLFSVELTGFGFSVDPRIPTCVPFGVPRAGTSAFSVLRLSKDDDGWVGHVSAPAAGDIELRLRGTGVRQLGGYGVVGTIKGSSADVGYTGFPARDLFVSIGGADGRAELTGVESFGPYLSGTISGSIRYSDATGASSTCPEIRWSLQRAFWLE